MAADADDVHEFAVLFYMIYVRSTLCSEWSAALLLWGLQKYYSKEIADVWFIKAMHFQRKPTFKVTI